MKKLFAIFWVLTVAACAPAHANSTIVYGTITQVKPVYTQVVTNVPRDVCSQVQVPIYSNNGNYSNGGNADIGVFTDVSQLYVIANNSIDIQLASSYASAIAGTALNLTCLLYTSDAADE